MNLVQNALLCDKISLLFIIFTIKLKTDMMVRDGRYMGQKYLKLGPNLITPRSLFTLKKSSGLIASCQRIKMNQLN
jgi:hypothetical protein